MKTPNLEHNGKTYRARKAKVNADCTGCAFWKDNGSFDNEGCGKAPCTPNDVKNLDGVHLTYTEKKR